MTSLPMWFTQHHDMKVLWKYRDHISLQVTVSCRLRSVVTCTVPFTDLWHRGRGKGNIGWALWQWGESWYVAGVELELLRLKSLAIEYDDFSVNCFDKWLEYEEPQRTVGKKTSFNICCYFLKITFFERWGRNFPHPSRPALGTILPLYREYPAFPGVNRSDRGLDHPPISSAEVKERVELYLYSPYGPFMACYRVNFTFTFTIFRAVFQACSA